MTTAEAGIAVSIDLQKLVNGDDANVAPGPLVPVGSTVTFTYVVSTGDLSVVQIENVIVRDDNGTPGNLLDDFSPGAVLDASNNNVGDVNNPGVLDFGEFWQYTATLTALPGQHENIATVSGDGLENEETFPAFGLDLGHYFGVANGQRVPEPATLLLLGVGLAGLGYRCRSRRPHVEAATRHFRGRRASRRPFFPPRLPERYSAMLGSIQRRSTQQFVSLKRAVAFYEEKALRMLTM